MHTLRRFARLGLVALLSLSIHQARAGVRAWGGGKGPGAENAGFVTVTPGTPSTVWAGHATYGILRASTDGGVTWASKASGLPAEPIVGLVRSGSDANMVTLATKTKIYRSTNGGASWTYTYTMGGGINCFGGDPSDWPWLYIGGVSAMMRSSDGGATWGVLPFGPYQNIRAMFVHGTAVYATASTGTVPLWILFNHGDSINGYGGGLPVGAGVMTVDVNSYPYPWYAATSTAVYRSTDYGATFTPAGAGPTSVTSLLVDPTNTSIVLAGTPTGLQKSTDYGASWHGPHLPSVPSVNTLAVHAASTYFAATPWGVQKTTDAAEHFDPMATGVPADVTELDADPFDLYTAYAGTSSGLFKTTDDGKTWSRAWSEAVNDVAALPPVGTVLMATANGLYKSTDGGATFAPAGSGIPSGAVKLLAWDGASTVYAGAASGVYWSTNKGDSFSGPGTGMANPSMLATSASAPSILYGVAANHLYESTNGGQSFSLSGAQPQGGVERIDAIEVKPSDATTLYVATKYDEGPPATPHYYLNTYSMGLWYWSEFATAPSVINEILVDAIFPETTMLVATEGGTYLTQNGVTFDEFDEGISVAGPIAGKCLKASPLNPRKLALGVAAGGVWTRLAVSNWNQVLNADFSETHLNGWTASPNAHANWQSDDATGSGSGSANVSNDTGVAGANEGIFQPCTPVNEVQRYHVGASVKAPQDAGQGSGHVAVYWYANGGCSGAPLFATHTPTVSAGAWTETELGGVAPPPGARSAVVALLVASASDAAYAASFDDVTFTTSVLGDANGNGVMDVADVFYLINLLFAGGPNTLGMGDVNGDGIMNVADVFYMVNALFAGGPPPVE